jgi:hypothetical protein
MSALEFSRLSRYPETAYTHIPADSDPTDELLAALDVFWHDGAVISTSKGHDNTYVIWLAGRTPFESDRAFRVRVVEVGQS